MGDMGGRGGDFERERARAVDVDVVAVEPARVSLSVERERDGIVAVWFVSCFEADGLAARSRLLRRQVVY